jgi:hypothetical protein
MIFLQIVPFEVFMDENHAVGFTLFILLEVIHVELTNEGIEGFLLEYGWEDFFF